MTERGRTFAGILLLAVLPVCVLYIGRPGDDAGFHVSSWMEMLEGWRSGVMAPAWAAHAGFGWGEPRFYFYPPLSVAMGAALMALLPAVWVPGAFVAAVLALAGISMLALGVEVLPLEDRGRAALLYVTSYYLVTVAVLRFAAGELLAGALLPLAVLFFLRLMRLGRAKDGAALSVALAAIWMSDVPAAVAVFYVLAACAGVEALRRGSVRPVVGMAVAEGMSVMLTGTYLVPALVGRGRIAAGSLLHFGTRDFMLYHRPGKGLTPAMTYPLWGWVVVGTAAAVLLAMRSGKELRAGEEERGRVWLLAAMAVVSMGFQLPVSLPLWRLLPELGFVQFPFRFDMVLGCVLPVVCLLLSRRAASRRWVYAVWGLLLAIALGTKVEQEMAGRKGATFAGLVAGTGEGYAGYEEYGTAGVMKTGGVGERVKAVGGSCWPTVEAWSAERRQFYSAAETGCEYRVGLAYYPDWRLRVDGEETEGLFAGPDGAAMARVPEGRHEVELRYERPWLPALAGGGMSALALMGVGLVWYRDPRRRVLRVEAGERIAWAEATRI